MDFFTQGLGVGLIVATIIFVIVRWIRMDNYYSTRQALRDELDQLAKDAAEAQKTKTNHL